MTDNMSARYQLPYLAVAQAQKEITHNESLLILDALLHPVVEAEMNAPPTITNGTQSGKCWLIGASPSGAWLGKSSFIAYWTGDGWRFFAPVEGMRVWNTSLSGYQLRSAGAWIAPSAISNATGGSVIDIECRAILAALLTQLRNMGHLGH
jgi:Protein of unknown function (DUF2793)